MKSRNNDEAMADLYRDDPALALDVVNNILQEGEQAELLIVPRQMARATELQLTAQLLVVPPRVT